MLGSRAQRARRRAHDRGGRHRREVESACRRSPLALNDARRALAEAQSSWISPARERAKVEQPLIDRLVLDERGIDRMIDGIREVDALPDPIGAITGLEFQPSGIQVGRMRVPLGVIGMIYESRPNVTADAAALCLKSGNACILRGGSEAFHYQHRDRGGDRERADRSAAAGDGGATRRNDRSRGGRCAAEAEAVCRRAGTARRRSLIERVSAESTIPVIKHLDGICHVYIDDGADPDMAVAIAFNSKTEKYAVCNAMETLLVAQSIAPRVLPSLQHQFDRAGVELRGCAKTRGCCRILQPQPKPIGTRNISRRSCRSASWRGSTKHSTTSPRMARSTPT